MLEDNSGHGGPEATEEATAPTAAQLAVFHSRRSIIFAVNWLMVLSVTMLGSLLLTPLRGVTVGSFLSELTIWQIGFVVLGLLAELLALAYAGVTTYSGLTVPQDDAQSVTTWGVKMSGVTTLWLVTSALTLGAMVMATLRS